MVLCLAAYLTLKGLDNNYFWDDEAQVAVMSRNLLAQGKITGWDGRNLYTYRNGRFLNEDLEFSRVMPPLMFLVAAGSFELFGASTFTGRLPFAFAGLAALWLYWLVARRSFRERPAWAFVAVSLMAVSMVFLLNTRQCRYYSLALLFGLAAHYFYLRFLERPHWRHALLLAASGVLLFYSTYLLCAALLLALGSYHLAFHSRATRRADWLKLAAAVAVFFAATLPYALVHRVWVSPDPPLLEPWHWRKLTLIWWNLRDLNLIAALPWVAALALIPIAWMSRSRDRAACTVTLRWLFLALGNAVGVGLFSPQATASTDIADVRYLILSLPGCCALLAIVLGYIARRSHPVAATAFLVLTCTNLATLAPGNAGFRWLLPAYLGEIHARTLTPEEAVANYLNTHARQDDLVVTVPEYFNYPLMFYAGDRVRICCTLAPDSPLSRDAVRKVKAPAFVDEHFPHWVIVHGRSPEAARLLRFFSRPHEEAGRTVEYRYEVAAHLEVFPASTQRPELPWHAFGTVTDFDPGRDAVLVFRRKASG